MSRGITHDLVFVQGSLGSKQVAQIKLDVPVLIFLIICCTEMEMRNFQNFKMDLRKTLVDWVFQDVEFH